MKIEIISCESGDWEVLKVDDEIYYEGHEIHNEIWIRILSGKFNVECIDTEISDVDMQEGNY